MELLESVGPRPRQARYQAALRPDMNCSIHSRVLANITPNPITVFAPTVHEWFIAPRLCTWEPPSEHQRYRCYFVGSTIELNQCFALHLQFHLRILLEDSRVALCQVSDLRLQERGVRRNLLSLPRQCVHALLQFDEVGSSGSQFLIAFISKLLDWLANSCPFAECWPATGFAFKAVITASSEDNCGFKPAIVLASSAIAHAW